MAATGKDEDVGLRIGRYEILKRLGAGGMAEVFLARASGMPGFQKMVVLKRILPVLAHKADFLEMFLNEARIAVTLQHPNIVQMYDVGVVDGNYFIAMEYLHGEDVLAMLAAARRQKARVPLEHALQIAIGLCAGLHYAHDKVGFDGQPLGIVHRDISPQNVIVTYDGAVKLLDFGVAKSSTGADTAAGILKGKLGYMSPEQIEQRKLDRRSDVFSLGIVLFELTLGRRLFAGRNEFHTLKRIVEMPVPRPRMLDPAYDPRLEEIVMRALTKDREARYQTARELQIDLENLARARGMYLSAIALQQFMERLFGHKREAWRESEGASEPEPTPLPAFEALPQPELPEPEPLPAPDPPPPSPPPPSQVDDSPPSAEIEIEVQPQPPPRRSWLAARRTVALTGATLAVLLFGFALPRWHRSAPGPSDPPPRVEPTQSLPESLPVDTPPRAPPPAAASASSPLPAAAPPVEHAPALKLPHRSRTLRAAPLRSGRGSLIVAASPWCTVTIDGVGVGPTPLTAEVAAGRHRLRLSNPEFGIDRTLDVVIPSKSVVRKRFDFPQRAAAPL